MKSLYYYILYILSKVSEHIASTKRWQEAQLPQRNSASAAHMEGG